MCTFETLQTDPVTSALKSIDKSSQAIEGRSATDRLSGGAENWVQVVEGAPRAETLE
jgi:hypothetical protein